MAIINGTAGNDVLVGTTADDVFDPLTGIDTVEGGAGRDTLRIDYSRFVASTARLPSSVRLEESGFAGTIESRVGNDVVQFSGIEALDVKLGERADWFLIDVAAAIGGRTVALDGGGGIDRLTLNLQAIPGITARADAAGVLTTNIGWRAIGFERFEITAGAGINTIVTGALDDIVRLGAGTNSVATGDGNDLIRSSGGKDTINAGAGDDLWQLDLTAGSTARTLTFDGAGGIATVASLAVAKGVERIAADLGGGNDVVKLIDAAASTVAAGAGNDSFTIVRGRGVGIDGGAGIDSATVDLGGTVRFYESELRSNGAGGFSGTLSRYDGVDITDIERLSVTLGDGDDLVTVDGTPLTQGARLNLNGGIGTDILTLDLSGTAAARTTMDAAGTLRFGAATFTGFETFRLTGGAGADTLAGGARGNVIDGGAGNDVLTGGAGADTLIGGDGNDRLYGLGGFDDLIGGIGNDTYYVDSISAVTEYAGEGIDTLYSSVSNLLSADVERLVLTGGDDLTGFGNGLDNIVTGNTGDNRLYGEAGRDTIYGGDGSDYIFGGAGGDAMTGGAGTDAFVFDTLETAAERDTLKDFTHSADVLLFDRTVFTALSVDPGSSMLASADLVLGTRATAASHHLIYNPGNGALYYDADGVGGQAQTLIAMLTGAPQLTPADIFLL